MGRIAVFIYGVVTYVAFLVVFLYAFGFVSGLVVPKSINDGEPGPMNQAIIINVLLLTLFAVQHTIMARPAFKSWWTKIIPEPIERSTFVLMTNLVLALLFWQWRPIPEIVWKIDRLLATTGVLGQAPEAIFQIEATPRRAHAGNYMSLLSPTTVKAFDEFINSEITSQDEAVTTLLSDDASVVEGQGIVVE